MDEMSVCHLSAVEPFLHNNSMEDNLLNSFGSLTWEAQLMIMDRVNGVRNRLLEIMSPQQLQVKAASPLVSPLANNCTTSSASPVKQNSLFHTQENQSKGSMSNSSRHIQKPKGAGTGSSPETKNKGDAQISPTWGRKGNNGCIFMDVTGDLDTISYLP